jgi:hypothetical protein
MVALEVVSEMVTDCAELYVPAAGENVGVAACPGCTGSEEAMV